MSYELYHLDCTVRTDAAGKFSGIGVHQIPQALRDTLPGKAKTIPADGKYTELRFKEFVKYITFYLEHTKGTPNEHRES